ncbi:MAG: hypothetical protein M3R11_04670, partial [Acidobacteriota bacterium]|nr:hypothetical protein [Acidobacteriota bacterium]
MKIFKDRSVAASFALAVLIAVFVSLFGAFFSVILKLVLPQGASFTWWKAVIILLVSLTVSGLVEKYSLKRVFPYALIFLTVLFVASILSAQLLNVSLIYIPIFLTVILTLIIVHLKTLWLIDSSLTEKLVLLASTGHLLEGQSADLRIESGLRLLESVLPLSEAIVFKYTAEG